MEWLVLVILALWIGVGCALLLIYGQSPRMGTRTLVRSVDRRLYLVGDRVQVILACSDTGLPEVSVDPEPTPWDIVLVIDHSGSMGTGTGSALAEAKQAAINLVRTTPRSFRFAVVEFDHGARELCPLTQRGRGLLRALKSIGGGGATDLAWGLRVAGQCLRVADTTSERKRAIILLSDGVSAEAPALVEARALQEKDAELLLITIGLGSTDMGLLRKLASAPEHCYRADQMDELTKLYVQIGHMVAGKQVSNVQVSEHFNTTGVWGLRAWGELEPAQRAIQEGRFAWLLATLERTPTELTYSLEALCPGWHYVALEPAVLRAQLPNETSYEVTSNHGPRLLVLPQAAGWQLLWLILNPLFFLLFGRWFCRKQAMAPRRESVLPQPRPLELPAPLVAPPLTSGHLALRPSLIISLGFGGAHALVHCKRLLWERGERAAMDKLRFLAVDTTSEEFFPSPWAGPVSLTPQERLQLSQPLEPLLAEAVESASSSYAWLPARQLLAGAVRPDLQRGTGHQRALGRLAVVSNRTALEVRLRSLLQELLGQTDASGIDILITGASGGGTASGGMLELCWLLRRLLGELGGTASTSLFLLAPVAREEPLDVDRQERHLRLLNARALMLELDRVSTMRSELLAPMPGEVPARHWFDRVFCVGPAGTREPERWSAQRTLYPKGGEALFCWLTSEDFRTRFAALDMVNGQLTREHGHCFVHRLDPSTFFLYTRTLGRYLVVESLRRRLAERFWDLQDSAASGYFWRDHRPAEATTVWAQWLQPTRWAGDFPWVFMHMEHLGKQDRLHEALLLGAGPSVSASLSPLERDAYLRDQRALVSALLDVWVTETLNGDLGNGSGLHALITVIHVLKEMGEMLTESVAQARQLEEHSEAVLVRDEAGIVAELASQAAAEIGAVTTHLQRWDTVLGEGMDAETRGLMRYLDICAGELRKELEGLMSQSQEPGDAFSRLPMTWSGVEALRGQVCDAEIINLLERVRWHMRRDGIKLMLELHIQGTDSGVWTLDEMVSEQQISSLAEFLIQTGMDLLPRDEWRLEELMDRALLDNRPKLAGPRVGGLNPGASGVFLVAGAPLCELSPHIQTVSLPAVDFQESRVVSCEQNLSTQLLWPNDAEDVLPFVFNEEYYAYRTYDAYCRQQGLRTEILPPSLVGLCRNPDALLAFALVGLAENRIVSTLREGQKWWVAELKSSSFNLIEGEEDALANFLAVANVWIVRDRIEFRDTQNIMVDSMENLRKRIMNHPLLRELTMNDFVDKFVSMIVGLAFMAGYFDS